MNISYNVIDDNLIQICGEVNGLAWRGRSLQESVNWNRRQQDIRYWTRRSLSSGERELKSVRPVNSLRNGMSLSSGERELK